MRSDTDQERKNRKSFAVLLCSQFLGEKTEFPAGSLKGRLELVGRQKEGGELWTRTFTVVPMGWKGKGRASKFKIG